LSFKFNLRNSTTISDIPDSTIAGIANTQKNADPKLKNANIQSTKLCASK